MATLIGIVSQVVGQVYAVASNGAKRALVEGDRLFAGETLDTGASGAVAVRLQNGQELTLGRGSELQLSADLLSDKVPHVVAAESTTPSQAQLTDVEQLQKAIAAGADPTQTGEATAAGPGSPGGTGGAEGGGHTFVLLEEVAGRVDPVIGFPTAGFNGIPEFVPQIIDPVPEDTTPPIVPPNNEVSLGGLAVEGGELTLNEANLQQGSASDPAALTQSGSFNVSAPDGLLNLSVGGISVVSGGVAALFPQSITTQLGNTLTITGYNPATGVVTYSYTLNGNETHSAADGANNLNEQFTVVASDTNGDTATGSLDINITDDLPNAANDSNAGVGSESQLTLAGNVLTNDVQGADRVASGPVTAGTYTGTYGTLVLAADGSYTYTLNPTGAAFLALKGDGSGTETFTYTLTDSDGDTSTANLVLNVHNNDDPATLDGLKVEGAELTFYENALSDGSAPGSSPLTQGGSFTVTALDGVQTLTVGGINVVTGGVAATFPQVFTTDLGNTLTITGYNPATGVVTYTYTLNDNEAHAPGAGTNSLGENFTVTLVDSNGTTATDSLDVNIVDDVPTAKDDSNTQTATETLTSLTGNVLDNDIQGADRVTTGPSAGPITGGTFTGTYGTLVLGANGTYTYTLDPNNPAFKALTTDSTETFTYTFTDKDGDTSTANLVLNVHNNDDPVVIDGLKVDGGEVTLYEKALSDGSAPGSSPLTQGGSFTVTALDGVQTLTVGGINVVTGGVAATFPQVFTTDLGNTLTITGYNPTTGVVTYTYTLNDNEAHAPGAGTNSLGENFTVTLVDGNGTTATDSLDVNIVDDVPTAKDDSNTQTATETLTSLTGNVLDNDIQGADRVTTGPSAGPITGGTFTGTYGTLVLGANGTYTYTLDPNNPAFKALTTDSTETFTYTFTDKDGDTSTANLVLNVHNNDDPVVIDGLKVDGGEVTLYEKALGDGSAPGSSPLTQGGSFTVTALDGVQTLTVGGINVVTGGVAATFPQVFTTDLGNTLTITGYNPTTGVVTYTYTLNDNEAHASGAGTNNLSESFTVTLVDGNGTTATDSLDVNIVDDVPTAKDDSNTQTATETLTSLTGNVLDNDIQGADRVTTGPSAGPITGGTFTGTYGTLVLGANGTYTYTLDPNNPAFKALTTNATETFTYTFTDKDGDTSTANLVLNVHNNDDPVVIDGLKVDGGEVTLYEKALGDGSAPGSSPLTQGGSFTVTALDGVQTLTVGGINVVTGGVAATFPQVFTTDLGNTLTITGYNPTTGVVTYTYTLNDNEAHATGAGTNNLSESFTVTLVDGNGTTATDSLDVNIVDDVPTAKDDSNTQTATETLTSLTGNVLDNDIQGADRVTTGPSAGPITGGTFTGTYGTLVLGANGTYTYTLDPNNPAFKALTTNATETFTYTFTDKDGDTSTANLVLNVHNNDDPVVIDGLKVDGGEVTLYEKALSDGSAPGSSPLTQGGSFTVTALDGVQTLTVGGINVVTGGVAATFPQVFTTDLGNTLTITGYNPATGVVTYTYTLNDNEAHASGAGTNNLSESFTVTLVDSNGTTATDSLNVNIVDDVPTAKDDSNTQTATETLTSLTGNVLDNDIQGADRVTTGPSAGPITGGTFTGTYGTLVLGANGTYTYTLDHNNPAFKALTTNATETFTYTFTDKDGDTSTANLVLNVHNNDDPVVIDGLKVDGGELTLYEKALSDGSAPGSSPLTQGGSFTVTALDGVQTLTVGGINVVTGGVAATFPQVFTTDLGNTLTITGYNPATGVVTYTYTLNDNEAHATGAGTNNLSESFTVTLVDGNGTTATDSLDVNIVDDVPTAKDDSNTQTATETLTSLTGNVLDNDIQGADRVTTGPSAGPITGGTFTGTYGTLVLGANGTYTYTLDPNNPAFKALTTNATETFTYTFTDKDGDTSTANLVLNVHNNDDPVVIDGLKVDGGELTLYEKALSDGSAPGSSPLTQGGSFTVTALDGVQTLTVGGINVVTGGVAATFPQVFTSDLGNTLTITGYNPATGVVTYTYTLNDNEAHAPGAGTNSLGENFTVTLVDSNGTTATDSLDVNIVDDVPTAKDDSNTQTATETLTSLTGNVLDNDIQGADRVTTGPSAGPITGGTFTGTYGTLVLGANGTYTYTLDPNNPAFKALTTNATETFTYTFTDKDGDTSTANLVLNVHNNDDPVVIDGLKVDGGELTLYEKALSDGSAPGSSPLTQGGSFTVTALDGVQTLTVGGINVVTGGVAATFPQVFTTDLGNTLTITGYNPTTGVVTYTYTLNDNEAHASGAGTNNLSESFTVTLVDGNGTTATDSLDVNIVDDVPTAKDDSNTQTATETLTSLTGNVLDNDIQGADRVTTGPSAGPITGGTFTGTYGTLVLGANGTYTYTLDPNNPAFKALTTNATETFTYTFTDKDGDTSTANLVLNVHNNDDPVVIDGLKVDGGEVTLYEKALGDGSAPGSSPLTQGGSFTVTALDGVQTLTVGGINVVTGGVAATFPQVFTTDLGNTLTITGYNPATGVVTYTYTLNDNEAHASGAGTNNLSESFTVTLVDGNGTTATDSLDVNIVDDVPTAKDDSNTQTATETLTSLTGNVLDNDVQGADRVTTGPSAGPITGGTFAGTYGTLVLGANGTYTYTLDPNNPAFKALTTNATETFTYTFTDKDGDTSTANLVLNVHNNDDPVVIDGLKVDGGEVTLYEKALSDGSAPGSSPLTQGGSFTVTALDGVQTLTVGGINVVTGGVAATFPQVFTTDLGNTLTITGYNPATGVVTYTYTLNDNEAHASGAGTNNLSESFTVTLVDGNGTTATDSLDVNIVDDVPTAKDDSNTQTATETLTSLTGNVLDNDIQGADRVTTGPSAGPITGGTFTGTYGTLVLGANGTYTYTLDPNNPAFKALKTDTTDTFTYTFTDKDGDVSTAKLVLNVHNNDDPAVINDLNVTGGELTLYENALSDGTAPGSSALTQGSTFSVTALDGVKTLTVAGMNVVSNGVVANFPQVFVTPLGNTLTVTGYNPATGVVSYTYTLNDNENHSAGNGTTLAEPFTVTLVDGNDSTATGTLDVTIVDDTPLAKPDTGTVIEGSTLNIAVLGNDVLGADGATLGGAVVGVKAGNGTGTPVTTGLNSNIAGNFGYLTLDAAGNAVYHSYANSVSGTVTDTFTYTIRDGDGDLSTTTITVTINDSGLKAIVDQDVTVYEKALDLGKDGLDLVGGTVVGSDPTSTGETATGTLVGSVTGGVGAITYTLVGSATGAYGQLLLNPNGTYTYTLSSAPKTTPNANDGITTNQTETFTYKATDAAGNTQTSTIVINIVDDVPKAVAAERSMTTVEVDTNLLIVLDTSGSMDWESGVAGKSRLQLAKEAITALLDKYDAMGDVMVKLVTFSSTGVEQGTTWVSVAVAKSQIAGLIADGGTNYDGAVAKAMTAFLKSGKLTGAQNVGYFFSDGEPTAGQEISGSDITNWQNFLNTNGINNYAIGLGPNVFASNLDPLAYNGNTGTDTNAVIVTNLAQLDSVLAGTVQGTPVTGTLLGEGGSFGADGGFIKSIVVDGITYTYDPKALNNQGSVTATGVGTVTGIFNTANNTLSVSTTKGGTLLVNLDTGEFTYTSQTVSTTQKVENFTYTVSDNDGDLAGSTLTIKVNPNAAPVAGDDNIITNVASSTIVIPGDVLLANDSDANGDPLTPSTTSFATGWIARGADFSGTGSVSFAGTQNNSGNQNLANVRTNFARTPGTMTAALAISAFLGAVNANNANDEDLVTVNLKQGEVLKASHNLGAGQVTLAYSINGGAFVLINSGDLIPAATGANDVYRIRVVNVADTPGGDTGSETYTLSLSIDYTATSPITPDVNASYTVNDNHGGSDSAAVNIHYQDGLTLTGTSGNDVLVAGEGDNTLNGGAGNDVLTAGSGNNTLNGGDGNDLLFSGIGNDTLIGGSGNDTVSYAHATSAVNVSLLEGGGQITGGAGTDILSGIENLIGSNYNDTLTGDNNANVITGGLGNDILNGGGGDDFLIGGPGDNTLTGGTGSDTFQWGAGNTGHDVVTDFTPGTDKLDLSQLLQGENATAASLDDYLHFKVTAAGTTIDVSAAAGAATTQTIDLAGVNLATQYGVTPGAGGVIAAGADTATIINGMLNDHSLKVDTV